MMSLYVTLKSLVDKVLKLELEKKKKEKYEKRCWGFICAPRAVYVIPTDKKVIKD